MLAGDRAAEGQAERQDLVEHAVTGGHTGRIGPVDENDGVQVAVAGMTDHADRDARGRADLLDSLDHFGQPGDRHGDIVDDQPAAAGERRLGQLLHRRVCRPPRSEERCRLVGVGGGEHLRTGGFTHRGQPGDVVGGSRSAVHAPRGAAHLPSCANPIGRYASIAARCVRSISSSRLGVVPVDTID